MDRGLDAAMPIYRLDPVDWNSPRWDAATVREQLWVAADNPNRARAIAARKTRRQRWRRLSASPWQDGRVTSCVVDASKGPLPDGRVVDANGRDVSSAGYAVLGWRS